jgi:histidinol phosphatase-like enzyme
VLKVEPRRLNIIFLDFDGVLVTESSSFLRSSTGAVSVPDAIGALNYLIAETDAYLVITSTWRLEYTAQQLSELLQSWGVRSHVLGITPCGSKRSDEIQVWLDEYKGSDAIGVFVILDDMTDMGNLSSRLITTDSQIGLTMSHARRACELLKDR